MTEATGIADGVDDADGMGAEVDLIQDRAHMHYALLRLAGRAPDDVLLHCRELNARDDVAGAASALMFAITQYRLQIDSRDAALCQRLLFGQPLAAGVDELETVEGDVMTSYVFDHPDGSGPDPFTGEELPPPVLTPSVDGDATTVRTAAEWATGRPEDVVGLWRVVRSPSNGATWPPPRTVWVAEVADDADAVQVTADLVDLLRAAGVPLPLVEVYHIGTRLPAYQDVGRLRGELVAFSEPAVGSDDPVVARVFDHVDDDGQPGFRDDHEILDDDERESIGEYLAAGEPLLMTTGLIEDVLDADRGEVVPLSFRTDGSWIWVDAIEYYLVEHGIAPDPVFLAHLREQAGGVPAPSGVQLYRALEVMQRGDGTEDDEGTDDGTDDGERDPTA